MISGTRVGRLAAGTWPIAAIAWAIFVPRTTV